MLKEYKTHFAYSDGDCVPEFFKRVFERQFVILRNEAVEKLNPKYEKWNKQYERLYGEDNSKYNDFIRAKQQDILDKVNKDHISPVKLFSDKDCDIAARVTMFGVEITEIRLYLIES